MRWGSAPTYDSRVIDYYTVDTDTPFIFDITESVKEWQASGLTIVPGFTLALDEGSQSLNSVYQNGTIGDETNPKITIGYESPRGLKDYWTYTSQDLGPAGTGYVSDYTGHLTWMRNDYQLANEYMSLSLNMVFSRLSSDNAVNDGYGIGWNTGYNQQVLYDDDVDQYYLLKADGEKVYFVELNHEADYSGVVRYDCVAENGSGMVLTYHTYQGNLYGNSTVETKDEIRYTFQSTMGRLIKITNTKTNHYLNISYLDTTSIKISQVTDTVGNKITFTYANSKLVKSSLYLIQSSGFKLIEYKRYMYNSDNELTTVNSYSNYDDNLATTITSMTTNNLSETVEAKNILDPIIIKPPLDPDPDPNQGYTSSNKINYTYDSNHLLTSVENDLSEQKIAYVYDLNDRITQMSATDSGANISKININYDNHQTIYSDDFGYTTTYLFDHYGHTINIQDSDGNAQYFKYAGLYTFAGYPSQDFDYSEVINSNPNYYIVHKMLEQSEMMNQTQNPISNHGFEENGGWTYVRNSGEVNTTISESVFGLQSLAITNDGSNPYATQSIYLKAGTYNITGYIKNSGDMNGNSGAFINVGNVTRVNGTSGHVYNKVNWTKYSMSFTIDTARSIQLNVFNYSLSTAYFDNIQITSGFKDTRYNAVNNSGFETGTRSWIFGTGTSVVSSNTDETNEDILGEKVVYMDGDGANTKVIKQTIYNDFKQGETYVIGGWGKADTVPNKSYYYQGNNFFSIEDDDRFFGIYINIYCTPTAPGQTPYNLNYYLPFNTQLEDWQYNMMSITLPDDVGYIRIEGRFQGEGAAYFDNIQLYHDTIATSYNYDEENGRLIETTSAEGTTECSYDEEGNLTGIDTEEISTDISYNNNNMVESVEQNNVRATIEYDASTKHVVNQYVGYDKDASTQGKWFKTSTSYIYHSQYVYRQTDEFGNTTTYNYNEHTGLLTEIIDDEGGSVTYTYNDLAQVLEKEFSDEVTYSYTYDSKHRLATITVSGLVYRFSYNDIDQLTNVSIDDEDIVFYEYVEKENLAGTESYLTDLLEKKTYGNGDYYYYEYNDEDMLVKVYFNSTTVPMYQYEYDASGRLGVIYDYANNDVQYYSYDLAGKLECVKDASDNEIYYRYDEQGNLAEYEYRVSNIEREVMYHYNDVTGEYDYTSYISSQGYVEKSYNYDDDSLRRLHDITLSVNHANIMTMTYDYSDLSVQQGNATTRVYKITYAFANSTDYSYVYTYDGNQNITQIKKYQGTIRIEQYDYHYDELNQLVREDIWFNELDDHSYVYRYDDLGNIVKNTQYAYYQSQDDISDEDDVASGAYYDPYQLKKVMTYSGITLTKIDVYNSTGQIGEREYDYDASGNPIDWIEYIGDDHVRNYEWSGRRLTGIDIDGDHLSDIEYKYNSNSIRTYKRDGDDTYEYILDGDLVLVEILNGEAYIYYTYDVNDQLISMNYNGNEYFYVYDLLGNVTGLLNDTGDLVVSYTYDAWGNILTQSTTVNGLDQINPYRYRGYRYDEETGYYYLQARYYDPTIGRDINAKSVSEIIPTSVNGINLYNYSINNPVSVNIYTERIAQIYGTSVASSVVNNGGMVNESNSSKNLNDLSNFSGGVDTFFGATSRFLSNVSRRIAQASKLNEFAISIERGGNYLGTAIVSNSNAANGGLSNYLLRLAESDARIAKGLERASKVAKGIGVALLAVEIGVSAYNNFNNSNLTDKQKWGYTGVDAGTSILIFGFSLLGPAGFLGSLIFYAAIEYTDVDELLKEALFD